MLVLIPFNSGLRFGLIGSATIGSLNCVLIPFNSGLRFGLIDEKYPPLTARLNPLQFGSKVRSTGEKEMETKIRVLIPFNSGLRFGLGCRIMLDLSPKS